MNKIVREGDGNMSIEDNKTTPLVLDYTTPWGTSERVLPKLNMYANNKNLYVGLDYLDTDCEQWLPYTDVTVNLLTLPYLESAIDTNNNGKGIIEWLQNNGFGEPTGEFIQSGFCHFPVFRFNEEKLKEIDSFDFAKYEKAHNMHIKKQRPLEETISAAKSRGPSHDSSTGKSRDKSKKDEQER